MYKLSRFLLIIAVLSAFVGCLIVICNGGPWVVTGGIALVVVEAFKRARRQIRLTTLGSARWAEESDLRRAGMIDAQTGLLLGKTCAGPSRLAPISGLFSWRIDAVAACRRFFRGLVRHVCLVKMPNAVHTAVFGPSGAGKGTSFVVPFLLNCDDSCVVIDFKGENARLTAEHRRRVLGHEVVLLDPYRQVTRTPDRFNPLSFIDKDSPLAIDECNDLAKAVVTRTGEEKEPHWNDSAEGVIAAGTATVVQYGEAEKGTRSLQTLREIICDSEKLDSAIRVMRESKAWNGMLARKGGELGNFVDKEKASVLTTVSRHLRFLDSIPVAESTKESSFDPSRLRTGKMTAYLILPPDHMRAQSPLLRLWISSMLLAVTRGGLREGRNVHFLLDEAASLGHLDAVDDAVDKYRGYGVRLQFYFQSLGQLKKCFPEGQDQTLLSNASQVFFAVNDNATADYVSARLGEETLVVDSGGRSQGSSHQVSGIQQQSSYGWSSNSNMNWQQQARRLLKPEEVMTLPPRTAITFVAGMPPIRTTLLRYYEEKRMGIPPGYLRRVGGAFATLVASALLFLLSVTAASLVVGSELAFEPRNAVEISTLDFSRPDGPVAVTKEPLRKE